MFFFRRGLISKFLILVTISIVISVSSAVLNPRAIANNLGYSKEIAQREQRTYQDIGEQYPPIASGRRSRRRNYNPRPPERIDQRRKNLGSGSRTLDSCRPLFKESVLTLLVPPSEVVHYTTQSNPSLFFYAEESSTTPLVFSLVIPKQDERNPIIEKTLLISQPGIIEIKLPYEIELKTGEIYLWQIGLPCKNKQNTMEQVLKAGIKKVTMSASLAQELKLAEDAEKKAEIYANNQIWYDALSMIIKKEQDSSKSVKYVRNLINSF